MGDGIATAPAAYELHAHKMCRHGRLIEPGIVGCEFRDGVFSRVVDAEMTAMACRASQYAESTNTQTRKTFGIVVMRGVAFEKIERAFLGRDDFG